MLPVRQAVPSSSTRTVYGPTTSSGYKPVHEEVTVWRKHVQKPPYNLVLPLSVGGSKVVGGSAVDPDSISIYDGELPSETLWRHAYNKAYSKLFEDINSSTSQLAATLAEARATADTINKRAQWLLSFTREKSRRRGWRHRAATGGSLFIEYRWVYEATAKDLFNAVDFLQNFQPKTFVRGNSTAKDGYFESRTLGPSDHPGRYTGRYDEVARVRIKTMCAVENPNLFWAQQMGLTNPAALAWELTKFSWLADWFGTLGEVLNSWDDHLGLRFESPCLVRHREMLTDRSTRWWDDGTRTYRSRSSAVKRWAIDRDPTIGFGPSLQFRQIKGPSLVRGSTAIALLTQLLGRK